MPKVSAVLPTYNRADLLLRAIDSVLNQTFSDLELIIVDDGSTDNTAEVVENYPDNRIQYIKHSKNRNASAARNTGIRNSSGEYIAFLDSDDRWLPDKLELQIRNLESRSDEWIAVYCDVSLERDHILKQVWWNLSNDFESKEGGSELIKDVLQMRLPVYGGSTLLVRRDAVEKLTGFDERFQRHQDVEFLIRLLQIGYVGYVDEVLVEVNESTSPKPCLVSESKSLLFKAFSEEIESLEESGHNIRANHRFELAKQYFRYGQFGKGIETIKDARPMSPLQYIPLVWSICRGFRESLT